MRPLHRLALATLLALPLAFGAGAALALSFGDSTTSEDGTALADPDAELDGLADRMSPGLDNPAPDFSEDLVRDEAEQDGGGTAGQRTTLPPTVGRHH
jgi:hypothetical protein